MRTVPRALKRDAICCFAPWLCYWVGHFFKALSLGSLSAAVLIILIRLRFWKEIKLYDIAIFMFFVIVFLDLTWMRLELMETYRPMLVPLLLCLAAFGSNLWGRPYTLQYARQFAQPIWWENSHFIFVNHVLTAFWGVVFLSGVLLSFFMIRYNWYNPYLMGGISMVLFSMAFHFTRVFPRWYRFHYYLPKVRAGEEPYLPAPKP